jgi:hypothetical protein
MDSKLFRLPTAPNYYAAISSANPFDIESKNKYSQIPTADSRFPGYAAPMQDGRLVTDYQTHCAKNIPSGSQFATKEWMTKNAIELMRISRERYSQQSGASYRLDDTVPPPALLVECTAENCSRRYTRAPGGIGTERVGAAVPFLFGTWEPTVFAEKPEAHVELTRSYEGGRNTPRGTGRELM